MATSTLVSIDHHLNTMYHPDVEFVDGALKEGPWSSRVRVIDPEKRTARAWQGLSWVEMSRRAIPESPNYADLEALFTRLDKYDARSLPERMHDPKA